MDKDDIRQLLKFAFIVLLVWLSFKADLTGVKVILAILLVVFILAMDGIDARFKMRPILEKFPSYKVIVHISPNWHQILKRLFPKLKNNFEINQFVHKQLKNCSEPEESLVFKEFAFIEFFDGVSQMTQIWSEYYKTFVDKMEIRGFIFGTDFEPDFIKGKKGELITNIFVITPAFIGFERLGGVPVFDDYERIYKLATFPFVEIIDFFTEAEKKLSGMTQVLVKKFPPELDEKLKKSGIKYTPTLKYVNEIVENVEDYLKNLKNQEFHEYKLDDGSEFVYAWVNSQYFQNKYYSISIKFEIFST